MINRAGVIRSRYCALLLAGISVGFMAAPAHSQTEGAFVILVGAADTLAVENFTRSSNRIAGELTGPSLGMLKYDVAISQDDSMSDLAIEFWAPGTQGNPTPSQVAMITLDGDTVDVAITTPPGIGVQRLPTLAGAFFYVSPSFLQIEQMVRRARAMGGEVVEFPVLLALGGTTVNARISDLNMDTVRVSIGSVITAVMDSEGRLQSASIPGQGLTVIRVDGARVPQLGF